MKIQSSHVAMTGRYNYYEKLTREESLRFWAGKQGGAGSGLEEVQNGGRDVLELSDQALAMLEQGKRTAPQEEDEIIYEISEEDKQKIFLIQNMVELLTGKKIKFFVPRKLQIKTDNHDMEAVSGQQPAPGRQRQGWGLVYNYSESYVEHERLSFAAAGVVRTADGREIDFTVQLSMSRTFAEQSSLNIRAGDAALVDPLVINFNGNAAGLSNNRFDFDLDVDGDPEQVSFVDSGSGFLALDLDGDGIVTNGSELFGPSTGDGFAELARHDVDGNGWIDENDPVFERLRIWSLDDAGNRRLFALGEKGVGAIFVGHLETPFSIKDNANELQGKVRTTGVYLNEDGTPGTIQQVDLAI